MVGGRKGGETEAGLAGARGRETRGSPQLVPHPSGLPAWNLAQGLVPARTFRRLLIQPVCSAKAGAGGREAQRLQGQKSWGPWKPPLPLN